MSRPWIENEDGPLCSCGYGTVVKLADGRAGALCLVHTRAVGTWIELPAEAPDDFTGFPDVEDAESDLVGQVTHENHVGVFIPKTYATYFAALIRRVGPTLPTHEGAPMEALLQALRTIEAEVTEPTP